MAIPEPGCCDGPNELLRKILIGLNEITIGALTLQSGSQAIGLGVETVAVVFPVAFVATPNIVISISRPESENLIEANIDEDSITVNGFTASLGAATGSANYKLKWMAT
jgi:hypothetical protein